MTRTVLILLAVLFAGCDSRRAGREETELFVRYAALHETRHAHHRGVKDELIRLEMQRATPLLLAEDERAGTLPATAAGDEPNPWWNAFSAGELAMAGRRLDSLCPADEFHFSPIVLEQARVFRRRYSAQQEKLRSALGKAGCDIVVAHEEGLAADFSVLDVAHVYLRLEAVAVAERLADNQPDAAIEPLALMLRMCRILAAEQHLVLRLGAARLRPQALAAMQAVVLHPRSSRKTQIRLRDLIGNELDTWPPDEHAWIGDRALGLHIYEMIRDGQLLSLLTQEETAYYKQEGTLQALNSAVERTIDIDQAWYLATMRQLIEGCQKPFYARQELLAEIKQDLTQARNTATYPIIADRLLLGGVEDAQRVQALDRARCEAWVNALSIALGDEKLPFELDPTNGQPCRIQRDEQYVFLWIGTSAERSRIVVPLLENEM